MFITRKYLIFLSRPICTPPSDKTRSMIGRKINTPTMPNPNIEYNSSPIPASNKVSNAMISNKKGPSHLRTLCDTKQNLRWPSIFFQFLRMKLKF